MTFTLFNLFVKGVQLFLILALDKGSPTSLLWLGFEPLVKVAMNGVVSRFYLELKRREGLMKKVIQALLVAKQVKGTPVSRAPNLENAEPSLHHHQDTDLSHLHCLI